MKHRLTALALSACTLVGGHFYNRRWDRAVFFFVMLVAWGLGVYVSMSMSLSHAAESGSKITSLLSSHWNVFKIGGLSLWVLSLIFTYRDASHSDELAEFTKLGVTASIALSLLSGLPIFMMLITMALRVIFMPSGGQDTGTTSDVVYHKSFSQYLYFGAPPGTETKLSQPPAGNGHLRGRFIYDAKPASGVKLRLTLNGRYETDVFTTDPNGEFDLRLPHGTWYVNRLITEEWTEKPEDGHFFVVSGNEPRLVGDRFDEHAQFFGKGIKVEVDTQSNDPQLVFTIRNRIALTWPKTGDEKATIKDGAAIKWDPYPEAKSYLVKISEVEYKGTITSYHPVASRKLSNDTRLPLAEIQAVPNKDKEQEYQVSVLSFDEEGRFLSQSGEPYGGQRFVLEGSRLVRESERVLGAEECPNID